jgi:hypothetical protein
MCPRGDAQRILVELHNSTDGFGRQFTARRTFCFDADYFALDRRNLLRPAGIVADQYLELFDSLAVFWGLRKSQHGFSGLDCGFLPSRNRFVCFL